MPTKITRFAFLSITASICTLALKLGAYFLINSIGLLSDLTESFVNLTAGIVVLTTLYVATRPPDKKHSYGHGKVEYFSSALEGILIIIAAAGIIYASIYRILNSVVLNVTYVGLIVAILSAFVNFISSQIMFRAAKFYDSITLEADAKHLMTDVWTTLGLVVNLYIIKFSPEKLWFLDPIIAIILAANITFTGISLLKRSLSALMDRSLPTHELEIITDAVEQKAGPSVQYHGFKTRKAGSDRFIEFHLLLPGERSVKKSHDLCCEIENEIKQKLPGANIMIHIEPKEDEVSWDEEELGGLSKHNNF